MTEAIIQRAVASLLDGLQYEKKLYWYHPPNEGSRTNGGKLVGQGMKAGVPDCCLVLPEGRAVFIELKYKKGVLSTHQKSAHIAIRELGSVVFVVHSDNTFDAIKQVREILRDLGVDV